MSLVRLISHVTRAPAGLSCPVKPELYLDDEDSYFAYFRFCCKFLMILSFFFFFYRQLSHNKIRALRNGSFFGLYSLEKL